MTRLLGAIIAGGASRRFGSDKAAALLDGRTLIDRVADAMARQADRIVVVGRRWPGLESIADQPTAGLGPLGGLLGALNHGAALGYDRVLTAPCDVAELPGDLLVTLDPAPAVLSDQPVIGLWPAALAEPLRAHLGATPHDRSMRRWIAMAGAREIDLPYGLPNVNTPADLAALRRREDPQSSR